MEFRNNFQELKSQIEYLSSLNKEDVTLKIYNDVLTISGASNQNSDYEGATFIRREIKKTKFERSFALSDNIDNEAITALCENGVLQLTLPKVVPNNEEPKTQYIDIE